MKWIVSFTTLSLLSMIGIIVEWPFVAANACPACFGFVPLGSRVYVERGASGSQRVAAEAIVADGRARLDRFYGSRRSSPRIFVCEDQACYARIGGGGSRGMALFDWALFLSPRGISPTIASHEMSHIELHARLGLIGTYRQAVPQWFDEGVAVVVSEDPRYLRIADKGNRCRSQPVGPLPASRKAWVTETPDTRLYAQAACEIDRWVEAHGGPPAVDALLDRVSRHTPFIDAYRSPRA